MKKIFIIVQFVFTSILFGQELISSDNIADLKGAVELERNGEYKIEFTGNWGWDKDLTGTSIESQLIEKNSIFLIKRCHAESNLSFELTHDKPTLQLAIFKFAHSNEQKNPSLKDMELIYLSKELQSSFSNIDNSADKLPDFKCEKDESFLILINNIKKSFGHIQLKLESEVVNQEQLKESFTKIIDDRTESDKTNIAIKFVDEESKHPIITSANINSKKRSSLFIASEILIGNEFKTKIQIQCDAEGYFFKDTTLNLTDINDKIIEIPLKSISVGKVFKIDKIEFAKGTANLVPCADKILRRVKDFLILNSDVKIEIQGHVNNEGEENKKSEKLSAKRALTIKNYFIKAGINKDRMQHKGFGSKYPVFANPRNDDEQQANRRVEIKIIK